mmetsp:Transcript_16549/g.24755  ORF Transcript_16549/g.24755 Transcript_16549/m.24755 type:complete len:146 (-) Transcript_16549:247-684(-)
MAKQTLSILIVAFVLTATSLLYLTSTTVSSSRTLKLYTSARTNLYTAWTSCPFFECPSDESYPASCTDSVIPPWPICKFHSVEDWVASAQDSATRCCGDDLTDCKCPKKDDEKFLNKIGEWCQGVDSCSGISTASAASRKEILIE